MTKRTYRFTRGYGKHAAGAEVELTEVEAIRLNNEAPGVLERVGRESPPPARPAAKPVVKEDL